MPGTQLKCLSLNLTNKTFIAEVQDECFKVVDKWSTPMKHSSWT